MHNDVLTYVVPLDIARQQVPAISTISASSVYECLCCCVQSVPLFHLQLHRAALTPPPSYPHYIKMSQKETPGSLSAKGKIDLYSNQYFLACLAGGIIGEFPS